MITTRPRRSRTNRGGNPVSPVCPTESLTEVAARALHPAYAAGPLDARTLGQVVASIGRVLETGDFDLQGSLQPRGDGRTSSRRPDGGRSYAKLMGTPHLELWLIEWGPSTFLDLHDHGGAIGTFRMLQGNLVETFTDLTSRSPLQSRVVGMGDQSAFSSDHVHEIWNATGETALSLHGYSPRLSQMTFYDHGEARFLEPVRVEVFEDATVPQLTAVAGGG